MPRYHVLVNPVSGSGQAPDFIEHSVLPLLNSLDIDYDVHVTKGVNDAGRIGRELLLEREQRVSEGKVKRDDVTTVVVGGGDGTAHEFMEGVLEGVRGGAELGRWELVTLPLGTANALHSTLFPPDSVPVPLTARLEPLIAPGNMHALASLIRALEGGAPRSLPVTQTSISNADPIPSHIVLSTALHANILADSEAFRAEMPGIERFKLAAAANISVFFPARVQLFPSTTGVRMYDPRTKDWNTVPEEDYTLEGPFGYFLSTTTTPRLEPTFVVAPTLARLPPAPHEGTMDIVVLRPMRDPKVRAADDKAAAWAPRAKEVLGAAYDDGRHIALVYGRNGCVDLSARVPQHDEGGEPVVEVFRCAGFEWTPTDQSHKKSHTVCADGSLYVIPLGGSARAKVMESHAGQGFWVWG
ncbi:hypothetical protein CcaverHIS002_0502660 [Cutaneotrichosporon cavernicola]|uniref:DAGKc domain-containing protein n=1 Tax=Cutaneotrichosporon cavernicola TaxID=279322 RepID=A0AA48L691_9TREE|nr:uncharacterized protein CcaverHIS019_0503230 [Cutaneotrichosporon cavernicola]BEI84865.1 hypothetical protein CcaverHIS002_0502660 [Cutaneotrichosporon cavernicola]BEI92695.1 hypothetical protein CcaverHIS019_0503230 [Cutaneotrichosporon cavernicola]BEJ00472.1 hypothetical protein CcaverHIS631_0503290 [Cutaneotrichosporon cavernicola]BEJ08241.1 hypothetical protein CcaverHIS641_0503260 [Cutaneotrichosporon cavernicola]